MTAPRFRFERETAGEDLALMPYDVRYRLDLAGIKLSLAAWQGLSVATRRAICEHPVATDEALAAFAARVDAEVSRAGHAAPRIEPAPTPHPWSGDEALAAVVARAKELGAAVRAERWSALDDEQRYALVRASAKGKGAERLLAALAEFELA